MRASLHRADLRYRGGLVLHTASSGAVAELSELYLRLDDDAAVGVGEVRVNIAYLNGLEADVVIEDAVEAVGAIDWSADAETLLAGLGATMGARTPAVRTLIDCALHDLAARRAEMPLARWLGGPRQMVAVAATNQTLFWSPFETFAARAEAYVARGFRDLKVRVAAGDFEEDLKRVAFLRRRFGDEVKIAADANGQWSPAEAPERLRALAAFGLAYVEQPIAAGDWDALLRIAEASPVPVMLDESVASAADVERIRAAGGGFWAHLKLVKLGGIAPTVAAARALAEAGVPFMIGQMNEGGAATAAALHVAAATSPAFCELYGADGLVDDPVGGVRYCDGVVRTGPQPGLGVTFDASRTRLIREF